MREFVGGSKAKKKNLLVKVSYQPCSQLFGAISHDPFGRISIVRVLTEFNG
jgi:hypothetical protein